MADARPGTFEIFGLRLESRFPLTGPFPVAEPGRPDLTFSCALDPPPRPVDEAWVPFYTSPLRNRFGRSPAQLLAAPLEPAQFGRHGFLEVLRFTDLLDFYLEESRIHAHLLAPEHGYLVEIRLLGPVLSYWMERRGWPVLHASAVAVGERAAAFLATKKGGKSSLAAALLQAGHELLTDDLLPLEIRDGQVLGRPGYPQMRLWPAQVRRFLGDAIEGLPRVHPRYRKLRVPVGLSDKEGSSAVFGRFRRHLCPLGVIYLPERRPVGQADQAVRFETLRPREALMELLGQAFVAPLVEGRSWQGERLALLADVVARLPVRRLSYPSGYGHLKRVREAILEDLSR